MSYSYYFGNYFSSQMHIYFNGCTFANFLTAYES